MGERDPRVDAIELQLFANRFRSVVLQMGEVLRRTALSVNVKERLDFSCALLDGDGFLVVNAPHIPVHLGAMGICVRAVRRRLEPRPGDVWMTNHPAYGGSHLPDITTITPVFAAGELLGYVANRAHHAEIGGTRPGSMPPEATSLAEEGVVFAPRCLVRGGEPRWDEIRRLLGAGPYPSRAIDENLADLSAAVAANHRGATALGALVAEHGTAVVRSMMGEQAALSERLLRGALNDLPDGVRHAVEELDDGSRLAVRIDIAGRSAKFDFAGSAPVHPGNLNATPAIVTSAVLYVLRLLVDEPIPLNEGLLRPVTIELPEGILKPPFVDAGEACPAVVGGNVETSQRLVDALVSALDLAAASQGTMNNVLFGNSRLGYYETVCGGAGAGPGFDGASAVHTHMTNTAMTDPEILEQRYPVRLRRFAVRRGSGGRGAWRGGDGVVRELEFLEPMEVSVVTQRRASGPAGAHGGEAGLAGRQRLVRADGEVVELASIDGCEARAGDRLVLETPGGGGWGRASQEDD